MFEKLKHFISSIDLAIILIAALSGLSISSTLFDTPEVFQSIGFRILVGVFFINLLTCTLKLLPNVFSTMKHDANFVKGKEKALLSTTLSEKEVMDYLGDKGYQVKREGAYFFASKNKGSYLAPHILHIGLLVIIVGGFLTTFQTTDTIKLSEGEKLPLPKSIEARIGEGALVLDKFETVYDENGALKNWVSTFDLEVKDWGSFKNETTRVNHPFKKQGLSIYQMAYSNEYLFHVEGDEKVSGDYVFPEGQMIPLRVEKGTELIQIKPMTEGIALFYVFDEKGNQKKESALKAGDAFLLDNGVSLKFEKIVEFTVLQVKYNPFLMVVFLGFVIASFASMLFWLGRYREIWGVIDEDKKVYLKVISKSKEIKEGLYTDLNVNKGE